MRSDLPQVTDDAGEIAEDATFGSPLTPAPKHFSSATTARSYGASFAFANSSTMRGRSARVAVRITAKDYTTPRDSFRDVA